jgi:putative intracellular protease/amidase
VKILVLTVNTQPEFAHPYNALEKVAQITVASPAGGAAPVDQGSVDNWLKDDICKEFWETKSSLWKNTEKLSSFLGKTNNFAAIFYIGGHGRKFWYNRLAALLLTGGFLAMYDLATDADSIQLIKEFYESKKVVAAICHGSAALVNVKLSDGSYLVANTEVTGFSNDEEDQIQLSEFMPFMLETELDKVSGGKYKKADKPWGECVVVSKDGKLITGQNPYSATAMGKALVEAITK